MVLDYNTFHKFPVHAFTSKNTGGVSSGSYNSLNLGLYSGDSPENVSDNLAILASFLKLDARDIWMPCQTHENKVMQIDANFLALPPRSQSEKLNGIDALITNIPNICIGVTTADCVPIVLYDKKTHAIAVVHAGWKGTVLKIVANTIGYMKSSFGSEPDNLIVTIGPSISLNAFEVGEEVGEQFSIAGFSLNLISARSRESGKLHIDLKMANKLVLQEQGVTNKNIFVSPICTVQDTSFFSARRQGFYSGRALTGAILRCTK